jgi:plastocyanin
VPPRYALRHGWLLGLAVLGTLSGCADVPPQPETGLGEAVVRIKDFSFTPDAVTVKADVANHTVTEGIPGNQSDKREDFDSDLLVKGDSFTRRFSSPGEYPYFCRVHDVMTGKVLVKE